MGETPGKRKGNGRRDRLAQHGQITQAPHFVITVLVDHGRRLVSDGDDRPLTGSGTASARTRLEAVQTKAVDNGPTANLGAAG